MYYVMFYNNNFINLFDRFSIQDADEKKKQDFIRQKYNKVDVFKSCDAILRQF